MTFLPLPVDIILGTKLEYSVPILGVSEPFDLKEALSEIFDILFILSAEPSNDPLTFSSSLLNKAKDLPLSCFDSKC